ncbi:NUDIX domain-containing protein [Nocardioides sp. zg-DK7169]|uniref:NUDIX hydrolase n=1 Tax=Nocardioides sp. zg-DK7169 TaxID=2736600 RepID=UPI001557BAAC|nr:NUDIX hydrolase [Nocardioides sp. zg-DK7169]NPC97823.1 NUDIX hydrolase [Nocardioides sp. zg-DK7169]
MSPTDRLPAYVPESEEEADYLRSYDPSSYPSTFTTVDIIVLTIRNGELCLPLVKRKGFPYHGRWALPGGFVEPDETLYDAALRELQEETGMTSPRGHLEQLQTYGDPHRDPRARIISVAYLALVPDLETPRFGSDAEDARFWAVRDLVEEGIPLAFDHARILADALERAASKLEYTTLATAFCEPTFTRGDLRRVYDIVWDTRLPAPNFHRKVTKSPGFVEELDDKRPSGPSGGAPSALLRAGGATTLHPPILRPYRGRRYEGDLDTGTLVRTDDDTDPPSPAPGTEHQEEQQ